MTTEENIMNDVQLLPLPEMEPFATHGSLKKWATDYARANVAHALVVKQAEHEREIAAKDAELVELRSTIEALRAEASTAHEAVLYHIAEHAKTRARAERLANLLTALDEMAQAGLNSEVPEHWEAALHDMLKEIVKVVEG